MNPSYTPGSLFLTPRAPNGKRLPARARHRHHMRASEDGYNKHELTGKEQQGTGGAMMPNQFGGAQGAAGQAQADNQNRQVPKSLSGQVLPNSAGGKDDKIWRTPDTHKERQEHYMQQIQQMADRGMRGLPPNPNAPPKLNPLVEANMRQQQKYERAGLGDTRGMSGQERSDFQNAYPQAPADNESHFGGSFGYGRTRPKDEPTDFHGDLQWSSNPRVNEHEERRKQEERRISPNGTGEEQEPNLPDADEKKKPVLPPFRYIPPTRPPFRSAPPTMRSFNNEPAT